MNPSPAFRRSAAILLLVLACVWASSGCAGRPPVRDRAPLDRPAGYPVGHVERGVASWYGPGFHGHKTSNGEIYDMHRLTAAHRTLPLGSIVQVRSVATGKTVTVRINDRGPFAKGRIIDLSQAAAQTLGMLGAGTDRVELTVMAYEGRPGAMGYLQVQVSSFVEPANAKALAGRLAGRYAEVRVATVDLPVGRRYRVLVGRYETEEQAEAVAQRLAKELEVEPLVLRDDT